MNRLLNIVNDSLLKAVWIITEQLNACSRFFGDRFVPLPNGLSKITANETNHPFHVRL